MTSSSTKGKRPKGKSRASNRAGEKARSPYADYEIWASKKSPSWHPIKKMRYVFFRMTTGTTVTDAIKEIHWSPSEFWHLIDLKRNDPFLQEYQRCKLLQARAMADSVLVISEGRDRITKAAVKKMQRVVEKSLKRARREKSTIAAKAIVESLLAQMDANDSKILGRNKLQIDAAKWMAKTLAPLEFGDQSKMVLGSPPAGGGNGDAGPITIQFVGPNGKVVAL